MPVCHQRRHTQGDGEFKTSLVYRVRLSQLGPHETLRVRGEGATRTYRQANTDSPRARMRSGGGAVPLRRQPLSNLPLPCVEDGKSPEELSL